MEELLIIINTVLNNRGKVVIETINKTTHLRNDIGLDSLDLAELTVRIEAKYDIDIFDDGIVNTVGEIFNKINQQC